MTEVQWWWWGGWSFGGGGGVLDQAALVVFFESGFFELWGQKPVWDYLPAVV
jgi:hypothetical protein